MVFFDIQGEVIGRVGYTKGSEKTINVEKGARIIGFRGEPGYEDSFRNFQFVMAYEWKLIR